MTTAVAVAAGPSWVPDTDTFGARLALVRWRMGWNVAEAAQECGLLRQNWRLWEEGREPRRITQVAKQIAGRTGVDYLWLVHGPGWGGGSQPPTDTRAYQTQRLAHAEDGRGGRVIERGIRHGDSRRKGATRASLPGSNRPNGSSWGPVSRLAVA